jgi:glycosyltransferase involved in cell wall biosynthesis
MISIVIPAYNEERNVPVLYANLREILVAAGEDDFELVFVDDGSSDRTWDTIAGLSAADVRVRGVRLSRNFGHQSALMAGLTAARGQAVVMMDADLQHPPAVVPQLIRKWHEDFQIVHAVRRDPPNVSWFKRKTSKLYYRLFSFMSGVAIEPGSADFCLLDRQVVDEVLKFEEQGLFLRGLVHWVGYSTTSVPFECGERHTGTSKYSLSKMLTLGWHGVSSFSLVPLRIGIAVGLLSSTFAFLGTAYAIIGWWVDDAVVPGWASSVAMTSFLFGVLFAFLAVLAEYVGRIVVEVRRRPRFLVRETTRPALASADRRAPRRGPADARAEG